MNLLPVEVADGVRRMTAAGIPVMGHLGLQPQSIHQYGGYRPRGTTEEEAAKIETVGDAVDFVIERLPG